MKLHDTKNSLADITVNEKFTKMDLWGHFDLFPENRRRTVNKIVFQKNYFNLIYNMKEKKLDVFSRGDIVYSAIPYDTSRRYIQRAAILYLLYPTELRAYILSHKSNLEKYMQVGIFQTKKIEVRKDSSTIIQAYNAIFKDPLFEIQIAGRLLQHDETGPISANIAGKFLFDENMNTGISEYIFEYLQFVTQLTKELPIVTDGRKVEFLEIDSSKNNLSDYSDKSFLTYESNVDLIMSLLPKDANERMEISSSRDMMERGASQRRGKPILRSEFGNELSAVRNNYIAHSVHPHKTSRYFDNVLSTENNNEINVVSDIHAIDGTFPIKNKKFNILAGDISDSRVSNKEVKGIYIIGNHELVDVVPKSREELQDKIWKPFLKYEWFKNLLLNPDDSWYMLPVGNHKFYDLVRDELEKRFPSMDILHNNSMVYKGIRYIGITVPVALVMRKREQQKFIFKTLKRLLDSDTNIPTVIVSHAPLFNELSMLSPRSKSYSTDYTCSNRRIEKLFKEHNIIGAIHGHHHIPASHNQFKRVSFAGKELFVVCSIYSKMNTGFELENIFK